MQELHPIDHAIAAHARWKSYLRQAVETGQSEWTVDRVRPDDRCDFGRWLLARSPAEKATDHYRTVRDLHARFHLEASRVLDLALTGRPAEGKAAMAIGGPFATVSAKLTAAMTAWKKALPAA